MKKNCGDGVLTFLLMIQIAASEGWSSSRVPPPTASVIF